jgi:hypothetical protein
MAATERSDPAWVAHEVNALVLRLAEAIRVQTGPLKSTLKKVAGEWSGKSLSSGCPQSEYLRYCASQGALAGLLYPAIEPLIRQGKEQDARVLLVRAICDDCPRPNDWSSLQGDLWSLLDKPGVSEAEAEEAAAKLELLDSERVLIDAPGNALTALRPSKEGPWPVYRLDSAGLHKEADDLVEWLHGAIARLPA